MNKNAESVPNHNLDERLALVFQNVVNEITTLGEVRIEAIIRTVLLDAQGSWLRPQLVAAIGREENTPTQQTLVIAAVSEMVHCASLLHDDVVDEGFTRRGKPTANAHFGNAAAVLCGDVLMSQALDLLADKHPAAVPAAARTIRELSHSALLEQDFRYRCHAQRKDWENIAERKTGSLLGFCLAGLYDAEHQQTCFDLGYTLGQFFQLCDDLKDFQTSGTGKPALQDIKNGNLNWVLLHAAERNPLFRKGLQQLWREPRTTSDCLSFFESWDLQVSIQEGYQMASRLKKRFALQGKDFFSSKTYDALQSWLDTVIAKAQRPTDTKTDSKVSLQSA